MTTPGGVEAWLGWRRPALVPCRWCGVTPGLLCTTGTGYAARFHPPRRDDAANLTDEQARTVAAALERQPAERQAARRNRPPLPADVTETRHRTAEAWRNT